MQLPNLTGLHQNGCYTPARRCFDETEALAAELTRESNAIGIFGVDNGAAITTTDRRQDNEHRTPRKRRERKLAR